MRNGSRKWIAGGHIYGPYASYDEAEIALDQLKTYLKTNPGRRWNNFDDPETWVVTELRQVPVDGEATITPTGAA
jgi:hypothetical protein